jgi:hypothetical protein
MSLTLSSEEQHVADLGEQRQHALQTWRDLVGARAVYLSRMPAMTAEGMAALKSVEEAERTYRDLHEQWLQAQERLSNSPQR